MGSFADSIKANVKEVKQEVNDKIVKAAVNMFRDVVQFSPSHELQGSVWSEGLLINQWYPSVGSPSSQLGSQKDQVGLQSMDRIAQLIGSTDFLKRDNTLYLTNNIPYAYQAEVVGWYGNGMNTAPYAMVDKALTKAKGELG